MQPPRLNILLQIIEMYSEVHIYFLEVAWNNQRRPEKAKEGDSQSLFMRNLHCWVHFELWHKMLRWQENYSDIIQSKVMGKEQRHVSKSFLPFFLSSRSANFRNYPPNPIVLSLCQSAMKTAEMVPLSLSPIRISLWPQKVMAIVGDFAMVYIQGLTQGSWLWKLPC